MLMSAHTMGGPPSTWCQSAADAPPAADEGWFFPSETVAALRCTWSEAECQASARRTLCQRRRGFSGEISSGTPGHQSGSSS